MNRQANPSAKAKEKQRHPQANPSCFTFAFAPTHPDIATLNILITDNQQVILITKKMTTNK